jgi:hypothetical protein
MSSGTELSAAVPGQHVHLILILAIFLLGLFEGESLQQKPLNRRRTERKYSKGNSKYSCRIASKAKSKPLPLVRGMTTCRGTAFSTPPMVCEL